MLVHVHPTSDPSTIQLGKWGVYMSPFKRTILQITLVMDNLSTHTGASLYKAFEPAIARALLDKLEFVYTRMVQIFELLV